MTVSAQARKKTLAMNEALVLGAVRQHELTEAAERLNGQLQLEITARKTAEFGMVQMRDKAVAASRAKDDFIAALSHELRTPLTPVLLLAEDAANDLEMPDPARKIFALIVKSVKLEARLIDDLLDLTRITHGKIALELQVVDAHLALEEAVEIVRAELIEKQLFLTLNLRAEKPLLLGDPVRLQQIFWNVLRNAVKFTPVGGKISVESAVLPGEILRIKIADTGIGISENELRRLFAPFSQGDHSNGVESHRFGGLGLGLSISRMLTELHLGKMTVESPGPDLGATFLIEFPLNHDARMKALSTAPSAHRSSAVPPSPGLRSLRILLVEDNEPTRTTLTRLLVRRRHQVTPVGSIAEAQAAAKEAHFDLLVSDLGLPDGNGYALMADLHTRLGLKGIALSGYGDEAAVECSRQAGFAVHLTKPVSLQALEQALVLTAAPSNPQGEP